MPESAIASGCIDFILSPTVTRTLEEYLKPLAQGMTVPSDEQCRRIQALLSALHQASEKPATGIPLSEP